MVLMRDFMNNKRRFYRRFYGQEAEIVQDWMESCTTNKLLMSYNLFKKLEI